jgi:hypothetical protein
MHLGDNGFLCLRGKPQALQSLPGTNSRNVQRLKVSLDHTHLSLLSASDIT